MDFPNTTITKSARETAAVGEEIGNKLTSPRVLCLYGELGSGKTTFVKGLARGLGITSRLLSPTFIIVRRYKLPHSPGFLYHLDMYRVEEREMQELPISDMLSDLDSFVVIEWAEKLGSWLPESRLDIKFSVLPNGDHEIRYQKSN
ncbi:tRNA (adenosine(37)-N6)-threonylcarbamoyltransferase complex ATPase subunit type 1 TsaE [Candidatus Gottesmanbacteria bacterium]|nr:tRNA (adenosine(37)-N6)-threonylcarbamoyltransferase complex ATPase subunit type 1 TsaE [Candidatus Gottesmanbacteria bacterium]